MDAHLRFRLQDLQRIHRLISARAVRASAPAASIRILEPAEARFDAPPDSGPWKRIRLGDPWGGAQQWACFAASLLVPAHWKGGAIELRMSHTLNYLVRPADDHFPAGPEGQVFINGARAGAIDRQHHAIRHPFAPGRSYDVRAVFFAGRCPNRHALEQFGLAWVDTATRKLAHDLRVAMESIELLDEASVTRELLLRAVEAATRAIDVRDESDGAGAPASTRDPGHALFYASVPAAQRAFDRALAQVPADPAAPTVSCVGHAHIDLAWLWPVKQSRHKCVRTFATQCRLLRQFPRWVFNQSSPQAYKWVEQDAPDLFREIRRLIQQGRWEADGATWVEMDTNLVSGESLVRQLLLGRRYFKDRLGVDSRMLWLPDVFGYSAALPQLLQLAGVDAFVTSKISWSQYNRFPHDTFRWRGLDGTDIATHFITTPTNQSFLTYNAMLTPREIKQNWSEYRQKHLLTDALCTFGHGDGGGGPTEEMIETGLRLSAQRLAPGVHPIPGVPRVRFEGAATLMRRIVARQHELPVWDGELYLEFHRGTYTSQAWIKRANRKNEIALHNAEWLACLAAEFGHRLDRQALANAWEDLLLLQFHDILPGSSVGEVYDEARPVHAAIAQTAGRLADEAAQAITDRLDTSAMKQPVALFNTLSWDRQDALQLPGGKWTHVSVPACGWSVVDAANLPELDAAKNAPSLRVSADGRRLDSPFWRLRLDRQGRLTELFDKRARRHVLQPGQTANRWEIYEDRPMKYDAWDIDLIHENLPLPGPTLESLRVVEQGPVRIAIELTWRLPPLGHLPKAPRSAIRQRLAMYAHDPRIDFETSVDWREHHQLLKVAFPVDIRATEATSQIQFGHLSRPTHRNTSWDVARFEVCAHRFVDLAEHGYGVALLNDCKYGHSVRDGVIRLTCIKSAQAPDGKADQGEHQFTYALLPHEGSFQEARVIQSAAELNVPVIVKPLTPAKPRKRDGLAPWSHTGVACDNPAVVVDTLKPAEDGKGWIVRLYESHGSHATATLTFARSKVKAKLVDLLEQPRRDPAVGLSVKHAQAVVRLRPFQVVSLRVE